MPSCASDPPAARARTICAPSGLSGGCEGRASATRAAILAVAIAIAFPTSVAAHGDWPEGPHRHWFEGLQRPDNHLHPYRQFDQKSLFCCGAADVVKTRFKVENAGDRHPEDVWYAWLDGEWTRIPPEKIVQDHAPDGDAHLFVLAGTIQCFVRPNGGI
jgi:hypothetical protein